MKRRALLQAAVGMAALWPTRSLLAQVAAAGGELAAKTLTGGATTLTLADVEALASGLRGRLILPGQADYEGARRVWNAMIDRRPALIARCAAPSDVIQGREFRSRAAAADRGALRWSQPDRQVDLRRRNRHRPVADAERARGPGCAACAGRGRRACSGISTGKRGPSAW
jgi:hypothetical protein